MTRALPVRWLALIATVVLAAAGILLGRRDEHRGDGGPRARPAASSAATPTATATTTPAAVPPNAGVGAEDLRLRVAHAYALAATNYSPVSYAAAYRRQLALATGALRRELRAHPPTRQQLYQFRVDDTSRLAVVLDAQLELAEAGAGAGVMLRLAERRETEGQLTQATTRYRLLLRRHARGWRVVAFTILPAGQP